MHRYLLKLLVRSEASFDEILSAPLLLMLSVSPLLQRGAILAVDGIWILPIST